MAITPEAKRLLAETIRGTKQDPRKGLRHRLLQAIHDEAVRQYRFNVERIDEAGLDEAHRRRRERLDALLDEQTRAAKPKGKLWTKADEKAARARLLLQAEKEAAATLVNRLVVIRMLEALGLSKPPVVTGGWSSKGYREFHEFGRTLCINGTTDATEGYATLLQLLFNELAVDLPGLFGDVGFTALFAIPAASLRDVVETLDSPELASAWTDDSTLGWVYQYWNDPDREALDEKINPKTSWGSGKIEPHEIASKTQLFTERYMVDWLLQNSLGLTWLCMCKRHGWTADAERVLPVLESHRADWRAKRADGLVALDALMPVEGDLEERWKYYVTQPLPDEAVAHAPASVRELKLLDPAAGSGHFLVVAFELLAALYREEARHRGGRISDREIAESIIEHNLHGIDIDPRAIQIAAAALYLKMRSLARDARPRRMNLVAPVLLLGKLPNDDPAVVALRADLEREVGIPKKLTDELLEALAGVDYLGSLLKVDAAIDDAIRDVELSFEEGADRRPRAGRSGSLAEARETLLDRLEAFLTHHSSSDDLGLRLDGEQLAAGVRFVRMVREGTYHLVCVNPPYLGTPKLKEAGRLTTDADGGADLFGAFVVRSAELLRSGGVAALVTMRAWMYLGQFSELREYLAHMRLRTVIDLHFGAFSEAKDVSVAMFTVLAAPPSDILFLRPVDAAHVVRDALQPARNMSGLLAPHEMYTKCADAFSSIEGCPLLYAWSSDELASYAAAPKLGKMSPVRQGMPTSNNARYLRAAHELPVERIYLRRTDVPASSSRKSWVPYIKGAAGRTWLEPLTDVVWWDSNGLEIKIAAECRYGSSSKRVQSEDMYFVRGVAFAMVGRSFHARAHRYQSIFGNKGSSVFPADLAAVVCLLNSKGARRQLETLNPGIGFEVGDVNRLAVMPVADAADIMVTVAAAFDEHEAVREPSIEFRGPGRSCWSSAQRWAQLQCDRDGDTTWFPFAPVFAEPQRTAFVSFAVGVALGRFSAGGEGVLAKAPASALPAGILFVSSEGGDSLDHPGAAPMHEAWSEHGAAVGDCDDLRTYLRTSFFGYHKKLYDSRPIYFPLSSARKSFVAFVSIHRWRADTLNTLLADHLVPTKRRLEGEVDDLKIARVSGPNKREADRRLGEVQRLFEELNDFIDKVTELAERGPRPPDDATNKREVDARYEMDLDDGVMVNSAALWPLLEPQWKEPKKWWKELANPKGKKDYDWSHLAARYFPRRVRGKCHDDPSLAVAHQCFWELHPAKAYAWELRLQDEIRPDFTIDEPGSDAARATFLAEHEREAAEIRANETKRRERKAKTADDDGDGPLFERVEGEEGDDAEDDANA